MDVPNGLGVRSASIKRIVSWRNGDARYDALLLLASTYMATPPSAAVTAVFFSIQ